jgi:hypothetical protein
MLRPPSEYELAKISLSSHVAKLENLFFDRAIIFFVPKVADKGVDLASLQCTIVQITDRGTWGKEEESFTVEASSFDNRKYREFDLTTDAEYSLKLIPPKELRMGYLEIYFDPNHYNYQNIMATTNNPTTSVPTDLTPLVGAINAGNAAQLAATQAVAKSLDKTVKREVEYDFVPVQWSNNPGNHISTQINPSRIGVELINTGNRPVAVDTFADITKKTNQMSYDTIVAPGGTYRLDTIEANLGLMVYTVPGMGNGAAKVQIKDQFPDILPVPPVASITQPV